MAANPKPIYVLGKRVQLRQPADGFRTGLDAVLLAAACPAKRGDRILDLGCGVGAAGFCVLTRISETTLTGIDIQADHIALAQANAALNKLQDRAAFQVMDIRNASFQSLGVKGFDQVICNPPYLESGHYTPTAKPQRAKALGHDSEDISVKDWIAAAHRCLKPGGTLSLIHRADYTDKIIQAMGKRFGAVQIIPLWPRRGRPAKRVIIRAAKDRKSPAALHPGIVLHNAQGTYTAAAEKLLRSMKPLL